MIPPRDCTGGSSTCAQLAQVQPLTTATYFVANGAGFAYARRDTTMLIKYAAASVAQLMPGSTAIGLGDMSMSNGATPADSGGLRHPSGTHNGGRDVDIAYYQLGSADNDLRAVCPHTSGGVDQYHCTSAPTTLDVPRTALFIGKLLESARVRVIGVDGKVGPLIEAEAQKLQAAGLISSTAYGRFASKLAYEVTNKGNGWYRFHHHHLHLSTLTGAYSAPLTEPTSPPPMVPAND